jgi:hypothetical protein
VHIIFHLEDCRGDVSVPPQGVPAVLHS